MNLTQNIRSLLSWSSAAQVLALASVPLMASLYTPADFGYLAVYLSLLGLFQSFITLRYDWQIPNVKSKRLASAALDAASLAALITSALGLLALSFGDSRHIGIPAEDRLALLVLFAAALPFLVMENLSIGLLVRDSRLQKIAQSKFVRSAVNIIAALLLAALPFATHGLVVGVLASTIVAALFIHTNTKRILSAETSADYGKRFAHALVAARQLGAKALISTGVSMLNVASMSLLPILIAWRFDAASAGVFFFAQRLVLAPAGLIASSVSLGFWAESSRLVRTSPKELYRKYLKLTLRLFGLGVAAAICVAIASWIAGWALLDSEWRQVSAILLAMIPALIGTLAFSSLGHLIVLGRHQYQLYADLLRLVLVLAAIYASLTYSIGLVETTWLLSLSSLLGHLAFFIAHLMAYQEKGL